MNFNSLAFLIFLPVVVAGYWILPYKARKYWLLAASYFFYMYWNPILILLLLFSTCVDYLCGLGLERFRDSKGLKRLFLLVSVFMNLGVLFFFKYWDFFGGIVNTACEALSLPYRTQPLNLILPIGISFYTFQTMSYTIDVYRGDYKTEHNFIDFSLYVTFFPQLVAGPIENPGNLLPQLKARHYLRWENVNAGIRLLLCGFFRKCVVADLCGIYVNRVYEHLPEANSFAILIAGALFCVQIYCDFAGYSEIAAGSARLLGIRLMKNFDRPYSAETGSEFFRRWHISLNRWFTNYVYIPLGGNRKGPFRKVLNTMIVFTLCGLWHGANWTYVLWGVYAGAWVCIDSLVFHPMDKAMIRRGVDLKHPLIVLVRRVLLFLAYIPAGLTFRAVSVESLGIIFPRLFTAGGTLTEAFTQLGFTGGSMIHLVLILVWMARIYDWGNYDLPPAGSGHAAAKRIVSVVLMFIIIAFAWIALLASDDLAGFAYFQF
ncbi:MAG: MBOAT family protein [Lachnospiraceae bacterium]|nr:MBOAT family protein [Lachnospiraceae bacterium]